MQKAARESRRKFELYGSITEQENNRIISLPIIALDEADVTSFQMAVPYTDIEVLNVTVPKQHEVIFAFNPHYKGEDIVAFVWAKASPRTLHIGDTLAVLTIKINGALRSNPNKYLQNQTNFYQAAHNQQTLNFRIGIPEIYFNEREENNDNDFGAYDTITKPEITDGGTETEIVVKGGSSTSRIVAIVPNPATTTTDVTYNVEGNSVVTLQLFDMLGKLRRTLVYAERQQGLYRREMNVSGLAAGVYFLRLETVDGSGKVQISIERLIVKK
jgi:hypothetical protein